VTATPQSVVLASRNRGKLAELQALFAPLGWQLHLVSDFSGEEPAETAGSFAGNALIKARHAARVSGLPAIADDSGLCVEALNGAPGVESAYFAGRPSRDAANNVLLLERLAGVPQAQRGAVRMRPGQRARVCMRDGVCGRHRAAADGGGPLAGAHPHRAARRERLWV
jgi:non-canonical purine NTP pyrophosphatase (RdgB/HAM1 family)